MSNEGNAFKQFVNKSIDFVKKIPKLILKFTTPLGQVLAWILLIIFIVILLSFIGSVIGRAIGRLVGINYNYPTYDKDLEVIRQLNNSGYESAIGAESFQEFKAFEYAVLMDAAEYLRNAKQEMFDIGANEGEYRYERQLISQYKPDEYNNRVDALSQNYTNVNGSGGSSPISLMNVDYTTNQGEKLTDSRLQALINSSKNERNVTVDGISENGSVRGGNNRVKGPYLVYEFEYEDTSGDTTSNSKNTSGEVSTLELSQKNNPSGERRGSLIPYIQVTKEDIEFQYYFDENNKVIEYPLILNVNNSSLTLGSENSAEINRALLGVSPVVFPDINVNNYTKTPYYSDKTTTTTYKIPLKTILGRYMPKAELLNAWSYVKQTVEQDIDDNTDGEVFMDYVINAIKGVYNEACLINESDVKTLTEKNGSGETVNYSNDNSNNGTFVTFEKAGIESTKYDINGLQEVSATDVGTNAKIITDFISAVVIQKDIPISYQVTHYAEDGITPQTITKNSISISLDDLNLSSISGLQKGNYVLADGSPETGYTPPSSVDGEEGYYISNAKEDAIPAISSSLVNAINAYILQKDKVVGGTIELSDLPADVVKYNPIFIAGRSANVKQKLKIEHIRMPILLVKSAKTWCREVTYEHKIIQNQFKQNNKKYIIPKSVSSIGLEKFTTSESNSTYRGKAYAEVFSRVQEKDVVNMLMFLEMTGKNGSSDSYEYMRDLYRLVNASQDYSVKNISNTNDKKYIHPYTYTYVYIPESILHFNDSQSQKIYWLELLTATKDDPITKEELNNFRTKDREITWQLVEYEKYDECSKDGNTSVYALSPFGSAYVRSYYETLYKTGQDVTGSFKAGRHNGADWVGRKFTNEILEKGKSANDITGIAGAIYNYEFSRLSELYGEEYSKAKLKELLEEESTNMPVVAVAPGKVESVSYSSRSGFNVKIKHSDSENVVTYYMHLKRWPLVNAGDYVGAGTLLGYEGCTGRSFGAHLHFQLEIGGSVKAPKDYVFPTFNPFYNEEKAAENNHELTSEYMSLYRTVRMVGNGLNSEGTISNNVPSKALVNDYSNLIQEQGKITRSNSGDGELDWNKDNLGSIDEYINYLNNKKYYDLYMEEAFFDEDIARQEGYLALPFDVNSLLGGDIIVKIDLPGALPKLTASDIKTMFSQWLSAHYKNQKFKGMKRSDWIMQNIFTDDNIKIMLKSEEEYKVSTVFAVAVSTLEQQIGTSGKIIADSPNCNIFSIKGVDTKYGSSPGYLLYQGGKKWRRYGSYGNAFDDFADLLANRTSYYFKRGNYTVSSIGSVYCPGSQHWIDTVNKIILEIMQYYPGSWTAPSAGGESVNGSYTGTGVGANEEIIPIAQKAMQYYVKNGFTYSQAGGAGRLVPPYSGNWGSVRQKRPFKTDCSTYVSWVIYEYAKSHGYTDLQKYFSKQISSAGFETIANNLKKGSKTGIYRYFDLVQYGIPGTRFANVKSKIKPGDILLYRNNAHHVEIAAESGTLVYTYGTTQTTAKAHSSYTRRGGATAILRLKKI